MTTGTTRITGMCLREFAELLRIENAEYDTGADRTVELVSLVRGVPRDELEEMDLSEVRTLAHEVRMQCNEAYDELLAMDPRPSFEGLSVVYENGEPLLKLSEQRFLERVMKASTPFGFVHLVAAVLFRASDWKATKFDAERVQLLADSFNERMTAADLFPHLKKLFTKLYGNDVAGPNGQLLAAAPSA